MCFISLPLRLTTFFDVGLIVGALRKRTIAHSGDTSKILINMRFWVKSKFCCKFDPANPVV